MCRILAAGHGYYDKGFFFTVCSKALIAYHFSSFPAVNPGYIMSIRNNVDLDACSH